MAREIGSLRALRDGESLFVGSSSGVFFVNTVRRAFSQAAAAATAAANRQRSGTVNADAHASMSSLPTPEECIYGPASHAEPAQSSATVPPEPSSVAELPSQELTNELLIAYFRTWHPLFPFLHGPTCLDELEVLYASTPVGQSVRPRSLSTAVTLQCILNIAKLDRPDLPRLGSCRIHTDEQLLLALSPLSLKCDLASIQALLAAQLYFVSTMCLHAASTVGGIILRSMYRSGLHRCPVRYASLNVNEREMRKRLFWSAYCLDRFVSQSLGHPLGFQDSDIDVCKPGQTELHEPVPPNGPIEEGISPTETVLHLPSNHPRRRHVSEEEEPSRESRGQSPEGRGGEETEEEQVLGADEAGQADEEEDEAEEERGQDGGEAARNESRQDSGTRTRSQNQSMQAQFIRYSRLVTRMIELFHKSIHVRSSSRHDILFLKADIDAWANTLPLFVASSGTTGAENASPALDWDLFLKVAHQQLVLLANRPALSLEPTSAEFYHAIQICVAAARSILRLLEPLRLRGHLFWPGFMSSVWMSGLIMAFACQLKFYSMSNAVSDISASLRILKAMTKRWTMAQNCHDVLAMLLQRMRQPLRGQKRKRGDPALRPVNGNDVAGAPACRSRPMRNSFADEGPVEHSQPSLNDKRRGPGAGINGSTDRPERNARAGPSTLFGGTIPFPNVEQPEPLYNMPPPSNNHQYIQNSQQASAFGFFDFNDPRNEWASHSDTAPQFDVFNGTTWGPLMELVDMNC